VRSLPVSVPDASPHLIEMIQYCRHVSIEARLPFIRKIRLA